MTLGRVTDTQDPAADSPPVPGAGCPPAPAADFLPDRAVVYQLAPAVDFLPDPAAVYQLDPAADFPQRRGEVAIPVRAANLIAAINLHEKPCWHICQNITGTTFCAVWKTPVLSMRN
jgi:hypothetical protein